MKYYDLTETIPVKAEANYGYGYKPLTLDFPTAKSDTTVVTFTKNGDKLGIDIASAKPLSFIRLTWRLPAFSDAAYIYGDAFERGYGSLYWEKPTNGRICMWYMAVSDKKSTHAYGVMTGCNAFAYWKPAADALTLEIDVRNGSYPVRLGERTLHALDVVCTENQEDETPFLTLQRFCKIMCPAPRLPKKPVYGSNSWYYIFRKVSQADMVRDADLLSECTQGLQNRPYCVVDEGWHALDMDHYQYTRRLPTDIHPKKFPDMPGLIDYIKSKDLLPGIWIRPLLGSFAFPKRMRMNLFPTLFDKNPLDPSVPETLDYVADTVKKFVGMGFRLIKHDFSTRDIMGYFHHEDKYKKMVRFRRYHDKTRTTAEIVMDFYRTIREAAGDDIVIIGCNTISHLSAGLFELERLGNDTSPKFWNRTVKNGVNCLGFRVCQHNTFYAADADCVGYTGVVSWKRNREWLNMLAVSGTPLFTSITPSLATPEIKEDLKKAYALASEQKEIAIPLDWFETRYPCKWVTEKTGKEYDFDLS